ncbi:polysaccharide biosynthesis tyrosine autokinase [Rhodococcus aerolatus]
MDIRDYLKVLRTRWRVVAGTTLVGVLVALGVSLTTTPQYAASSQLFITTTANTDTSSGAYQGSQFSQQRVVSYTQLLTGQQVAQRVIDQLRLGTSPASLASRVSVASVPDSVILAVTVQDPSPTQARDLTNAVAQQFTGLVAELETPAGGGTPAARVTVVQQASAPSAPVVPNIPRNLALGLAAGLLLGVGLAVIRERLDTTVKTRERAAESAGTAVIGSVPFDKDRPEHPLVDFEARNSISAEAFRALRTNLQFLDVDNPPAAITVSSSVPGEGKTTTAINLAHVLAEADKHVILVEADLRRPRVARYLGLVENVGLTTVLTGQAGLADVLQNTANPNLLVLAAGAHPPNPSEMLGSTQMRTLLTEMRGHADYIVFDAPPLLAVTDATVLTTITDGALLVVRHGHTKRDQLARAAANLRAVEAPLLGAVVNMTPHKGAEEYEYYYYESEEPGSGSSSDASPARTDDAPRQDAADVPDPAAHPHAEPRQPVTTGAGQPSPTARRSPVNGFARHRTDVSGGGRAWPSA